MYGLRGHDESARRRPEIANGPAGREREGRVARVKERGGVLVDDSLGDDDPGVAMHARLRDDRVAHVEHIEMVEVAVAMRGDDRVAPLTGIGAARKVSGAGIEVVAVHTLEH